MPTGKVTKESAYREGMLQYFNRILVEQGVIGKLVEVESAKGDTVEVFVE